ncbi:MAG: Smf protein [Pseudomonadota bacterium]
MDRDELADWLRLTLTPGLGAGRARRLLAAFGLPAQVFAADPAALRELLSPSQVLALSAEPCGLAEQVDTTWQWLEQGQGKRRVLTLADADYPSALLQIEDPPLMLYAMGQPLARPGGFTWPEAIAIVGSRNPTPQGAITARQFARSFAQSGWCVVSGLALGIDGAAHEGALEGAPPQADLLGPTPATLAVVGTGLDRTYPSRHQDLAGRIAARGVILGEYPLGTPPLPANFPRRNRILCALARGTLVVEAAVQSGSLITARLAAEQGREVFAIPGSIHSPQSRGCHALIKQGAKLVETAQEVLDELPALPSPAAASGAAPVAGGTTRVTPAPACTDPVLEALAHDPATLDALMARTGLDTAALLARLLELELQGALARLPGGLYQRTAIA